MGAAGLAGCRLRLPPRRGGRTASVPRAGSRRVFAFQFNVPRGARVDRTRPARPRGHPRLLPTATAHALRNAWVSLPRPASSSAPPSARSGPPGPPDPACPPVARVRSALPKGVSVTYPCYRYLRVYLREPRDSSTWILVRAPRPRYRCDYRYAPRAPGPPATECTQRRRRRARRDARISAGSPEGNTAVHTVAC